MLKLGAVRMDKWTIEVDVDASRRSRFRATRAGCARYPEIPRAGAAWNAINRSPQNPQGFRLGGVDGRGRQTLLRDPSTIAGESRRPDRGPPGAGTKAIRFDLEWGGGGRAVYRPMAGRLWNTGRNRGRDERWVPPDPRRPRDHDVRFTGRGTEI